MHGKRPSLLQLCQQINVYLNDGKSFFIYLQRLRLTPPHTHIFVHHLPVPNGTPYHKSSDNMAAPMIAIPREQGDFLIIQISFLFTAIRQIIWFRKQ